MNVTENNKKPAPDDPASDDGMDKIEIFSNTDDRLKFLGKMLNNDSSRKILSLLVEHELTANEISLQTELSLSLILHHLNKMMQAGIVSISKTSMNTKNQPMKYYRAKSGILILPEKASEKAKKSKSLFNSLNRIFRFASIGIAGFVSWILSNLLSPISLSQTTKDVEVLEFSRELSSIVIALTIIIVGLIVEIVSQYRKKEKEVLN